MANPFLMTEEELSPQSNDQYSNPFLMESNEDETENPFMSQGVCNPFSDFGTEGGLPDSANTTTLVSEMAGFPMNVIPNVVMDAAATGGDNKKKSEDIDSAMSFFGTTITDQDELEDSQGFNKPNVSIKKDEISIVDMMGYTEEDEAFEDQLSVRTVPPSRTTQDLILSVSDQLDQNSSHLLDRIPVTRTPSPVSMRDLHSPSPTPGFDDLLDITDELPDDNQSMQPLQLSNDNPFASIAEPEVQKPKVEPARPPPPRPIPPRPTPPRRPSPPQVVATPQRPPSRPAPPQSDVDLFDMFGSEAPVETKKAPPAPKSNQDILNLFSVGTAVQLTAAPIPNADLLCDDIVPMDNSAGDFGYGSVQDVMTTKHQSPPTQSPALSHQSPEEKLSAVDPHQHPDLSLTHEDEVVEIKTASAKSSPSAEIENISEAHSAVITPETTGNVTHNPVTEPDPTLCFVEAASYSIVADEQMDTTVDSVLVTPSPSVNPFSSPEEDREDVVPMAVPVIVAEEELSFDPTPQAPKAADLFDAFAAKFDSVKKEEPNLLDGFGPPSRSVSAEFGNFCLIYK